MPQGHNGLPHGDADDYRVRTAIATAPATAIAPAAAGPSEWLLELCGVEKSYGGVRALRGVDFHVSAPGTVHGLVGENGSGKSTLLKVLAGLVQPDGGLVRSQGTEVTIANPAAAVRHGIATVSQETAVGLDLSVAENVLMGRLPRKWGAVDWSAAYRRTATLLERLEMTCDPRELLRRLRPDERQMVEIARALSIEPRILILDEPTSSLTGDEVEAVLAAIRSLKRHEVATILVSHRLPELFAVADEVTVLRDGRAVALGPCESFTPRTLVAAMVGDGTAGSGVEATDDRVAATRTSAAPSLRVRDLAGRGFVGVSLDLLPGEIVGLAGLVGSGRSDLLRTIFGVAPAVSGTMLVGSEKYSPHDPRGAIEAGLGYVPPERKTDGLVLAMSVKENVAMAVTARSRSGPLGRSGPGIAFEDLLNRFSVRLSALEAPAETLSGGNQQKVALTKWLATDSRILLLDEPTRGVDVMARSQIHQRLRDLAATGISLIVSSSENPELLEICDRVIVMFGGRMVGTYGRAGLTEPDLAVLCGGDKGRPT